MFSPLLGGFSFDALDAIAGGQAGGLGLSGFDPGTLAGLANSVGGGVIFNLASDKLADIVDNLDADGFANFDPAALSGMFAGLGHDQITGFDPAKMEAAIEAAEANFLGGFGGFEGIQGGDTDFGLLADLRDLGDVLGGFQGVALGIFSGDLFGQSPG